MTIELFRSLSDTLEQIVLKVDTDLPLADDIHPAIRQVGEYLADLVRLPTALAKLEAQKVSAEACLPARAETVRLANHAVRMAEAKLRKIEQSLARNVDADTGEDDVPAATPAVIEGIVLPTRKELIERLRKDAAVAGQELAAARAAAKKAESNRKGAVTRVANLAKRIEAAKKAVADHADRLKENIKLLRKTIGKLLRRQENRDTKRAERAATTIPVETAAEPPKGPTDEDIRRMAASEGLSIDCPDDLEAARQLFFN